MKLRWRRRAKKEKKERNCWTKCNGKPGNGIVKNLRRQIDLLVTWSNIKCLHIYIYIWHGTTGCYLLAQHELSNIKQKNILFRLWLTIKFRITDRVTAEKNTCSSFASWAVINSSIFCSKTFNPGLLWLYSIIHSAVYKVFNEKTMTWTTNINNRSIIQLKLSSK